MYLRPTPPLSEEASKEILAELESPVKDTPELKKQKEQLVVAAALSAKAKAKWLWTGSCNLQNLC